MRHLWSLLVGLVVAPLAWLTISIGQVGSAKEFDTYNNKGVFVASDFVRPFLLFAFAGLLLGVIACLRISPVGAAVVGVGYLAPYVGLMLWPHRTYDLFAYTFRLSFLHGQGKGDLSAPLTSGLAPVIGALLIVAVFSTKRWRSWPKTVGAHSVAAKDSEPRTPVVPAPYGDPASVPAPSWTPTPEPATTASFPAVPAPAAPEPEERLYTPTRSVEPEPAGTVVWTRGGSQSTTETVSATGRGRSPWDTPPGEDGEGSQSR